MHSAGIMINYIKVQRSLLLLREIYFRKLGLCISPLTPQFCFSEISHKVILNYRCYSSSSVKLKNKRDSEYDIVVIGGGIVGTASARELIMRNPQCKVAIVEKENKLAAHQSGHNSGVIHAGIYYQPGSLKAKLCVEGMYLTYKYCDAEGIPYKKCGKLIVAIEKEEVPRLLDLHKRALQNGVSNVELIEGDCIKDYEPYCQGVKALWSPHTGIVDWGLVTKHYGDNFTKMGGKIHLNFKVEGFETVAESQVGLKSSEVYPLRVVGDNNQAVRCKYVLACGGLQSDRLAELSNCSTNPRVVPFRGEYLLLKPEKAHLVRGNIYPVPDPRFPFLGVHFTPRMNGDVWLGPNAVLALKREGYKWSDLDIRELFATLRYKGFRKLARKYASFGAREIAASLVPRLQIRHLRRFIPDIGPGDLIKGPTGVRAQAMSDNGDLVDEFVFQRGNSGVGNRVLHCRNAPSPAATSSLAIARVIADKVSEEFDL